MRWRTYLFTYTVASGHIKPGISTKRLKIEWKLLLTTYIKSYTGFRLPPKCMTLNDLCARFKVIDSLNAANMAKYSLVMTPTPCKVAWCIISVTYVGIRALTYLFTYLHSWLGFGEYKTVYISETVEDRAKATINGLYKVVQWLSIAAQMYDLESSLSEIQGHWFLKCRKNGEIQLILMTPTPCRPRVLCLW